MKRLILSVLLLSVGILHAKALLRETSPLQNSIQPVPDKELVFARSEQGTVAVYLGLDGGTAQVVDPAAIRVARATPFALSELFVDDCNATAVTVVEGKGVAYKGQIVITHLQRTGIGRIESEQYQLGGAALPTTNELEVSINGFTATVNITGSGPGLFLTVYPVVPDTAVNLTQNDVELTDTVGTVKFSRLRQEMIDRVSGNLGQDWAKFPATSSVDLADNVLLFGRDSGSALQGSTGQIAIYAGAQPAIVAESKGDGGGAMSGTILVNDLALGSDTVTLSVVATGIPMEALTLQYSPTLTDATWLAVVGTNITANVDGTLTVTAPRSTSDKAGFWRFVADDTVSTVVTVNGDLNVIGGILMVSPNGTKWRITVTDSGSLSIVGM